MANQINQIGIFNPGNPEPRPHAGGKNEVPSHAPAQEEKTKCHLWGIFSLFVQLLAVHTHSRQKILSEWIDIIILHNLSHFAY